MTWGGRLNALAVANPEVLEEVEELVVPGETLDLVGSEPIPTGNRFEELEESDGESIVDLTEEEEGDAGTASAPPPPISSESFARPSRSSARKSARRFSVGCCTDPHCKLAAEPNSSEEEAQPVPPREESVPHTQLYRSSLAVVSKLVRHAKKLNASARRKKRAERAVSVKANSSNMLSTHSAPGPVVDTAVGDACEGRQNPRPRENCRHPWSHRVRAQKSFRNLLSACGSSVVSGMPA